MEEIPKNPVETKENWFTNMKSTTLVKWLAIFVFALMIPSCGLFLDFAAEKGIVGWIGNAAGFLGVYLSAAGVVLTYHISLEQEKQLVKIDIVSHSTNSLLRRNQSSELIALILGDLFEISSEKPIFKICIVREINRPLNDTPTTPIHEDYGVYLIRSALEIWADVNSGTVSLDLTLEDSPLADVANLAKHDAVVTFSEVNHSQHIQSLLATDKIGVLQTMNSGSLPGSIISRIRPKKDGPVLLAIYGADYRTTFVGLDFLRYFIRKDGRSEELLLNLKKSTIFQSESSQRLAFPRGKEMFINISGDYLDDANLSNRVKTPINFSRTYLSDRKNPPAYDSWTNWS